ncbi:MAG: hypothetical protein HOE19_03690 [Candidatus Komeilibacteria bacterium]|jgi:hypothetical protein|nr:hypothetical protein [Candidatus Komeilibacteria bacterium]MBT4447779.1 hypothetical protein [Candidatus Komeilibacteria bacterium]
MSKILANLNVAILGDSHEQEGSEVWRQVKSLATWLVESPGHRVIAAGPNGVAKAAAEAVRQVVGVPETGQSGRLDVYVDQREGREFYNAECRGDGTYFGNLKQLVAAPDAWVFFPGHQGTTIQLEALLHQIRLGEIGMEHRRIFLVCDKGHVMSMDAKGFYQNVSDSSRGSIHFPWSRVRHLPPIQAAIEDLSASIPEWILEVHGESSASTLHDFKNSFLRERGVNSSTAGQVAEVLAKSGQIKFAQTA